MRVIASELRELKKRLIHFFGLFGLVAFSLLSLSVQEISFFGVFIPLPVFGTPTLATSIFLSAKETLVPAGISVVALGPVSSFLAPVLMAFLVTFLITFPFGLFSFMQFLRPALRSHEKRILSLVLLPALFLFYLGCALSYFVIIPETFSILYSFADPMGVAPLFALDDFIVSVFALTVSVGIAFLLPIAMVTLSRVGLISGTFWWRHFRGAILGTLIFSALITPDGSGVTMLFLSGPLLGLYAIGAFLARPKTMSVV